MRIKTRLQKPTNNRNSHLVIVPIVTTSKNFCYYSSEKRKDTHFGYCYSDHKQTEPNTNY